MLFSSVHHIAIICSNYEKSKDFYGGRLGLELYGIVEGRHIFFKLPEGSMLLCFLSEASRMGELLPAHGAAGQQHLAFEVEKADYGAWRKKLEGSSIPVEHEQTWARGIRSFYFRDPDGHLLEICEPGIWDKI